jgi:hypothetical protein
MMLGLSGTDILASITYAVNQFLLPSDSGNLWAFGNIATCQISGFMSQSFVIWVWWYNGILSFYFLFSQIRGKKFVLKCELWLHLSGLYFPITAFIGYHAGWYAQNNKACWITDRTIVWIVAGVPVVITYISLIINNIVIYVVVRKSIRSAGSTLVKKRLKREARTLMFLYVACFFVTVSPSFITQILSLYHGLTRGNRGNIYPLLVLDSALKPLQGFFNFFIYIRPAYKRFRHSYPNKPMYFVMQQALFNPKIPRMTFENHRSPSAVAEEESYIGPDLDFVLRDHNFEEKHSLEEPDLESKRKIPSKMPTKNTDVLMIDNSGVRKVSTNNVDANEDDSVSDTNAYSGWF